MNLAHFKQLNEYMWEVAPQGNMRVSAIIYADRELMMAMDDKVCEQISNVATLPGIVGATYVMPDAHWGYGFPIGGVAAFDPDKGGVISAGGVGYDISCGVRTLYTGQKREDIEKVKVELADALSCAVPAGVGSVGCIHLNMRQLNDMLLGGARWALEKGYGETGDMDHIEELGCMGGADPAQVSDRAKTRQQDEMGTLGSGNHYLEVQYVAEIFQPDIADQYNLNIDDVVVSIHCGSRGLGHQIGSEFLKEMAMTTNRHGIRLPDRELACAPIRSEIGERYLGAMRAAINCALANRQIITHLIRQAFACELPKANLCLFYDVSHNTCKEEEHYVNGVKTKLFVHRKGATRAYGPRHPEIPAYLRDAGQPVIIGGSMGTASYILAGTGGNGQHGFSSACHGAGRAMSRRQAKRQWHGHDLVESLSHRGIIIKSPSMRGVAEEAPGAYKDVTAVVDVADRAGLARKVVRLKPMICIKG